MMLVTPAARGLVPLLPCLCRAWARARASNLLPLADLSLYPDPVRPMELLISLLTLEWDILHVLVDCVELEAAESFLLEDKLLSWEVFLVTVQLFLRRGWFTTNL